MIRVHRINGSEFLINERHIEIMEETPNTVITMTNDRKYIVTEKPDEIIDLISAYQKRIEIKRREGA